MGFINYHGTKEKHYGEVVEYADIQVEQERQKRDEQKKAEWFASFSGEPKYASADANTLIKLTVKAYRDAADQYRTMQVAAGEADTLQLWQDLWLYSTERCLESMEIPEEKQSQLLKVLSEKMLHLEGATTAERHFSEKENRKYQRYLRSCFAIDSSHPPTYWCWLAGNGSVAKANISDLLGNYEKYCLYLRYYLYRSIHPVSERWIHEIESDRTAINGLKVKLQRDQTKAPTAKKLQNPLYYKSSIQDLLLFTHALLFRLEQESLQEDPDMIADLYEFINENTGNATEITSILPSDIERQIQDGQLPVFDDASITGLQPEENIHYINHVVVFKQMDCGEEMFAPVKGTMAITDKRIAFRSAGVNDILLSDLYRVTQFDMIPEIMELKGRNQVCYVRLPDMSVAYKVLQMVANPKTEGQAVGGERVPFSYEELVEKADLGACIFAFECLESYPFPGELKEKTRLLLKKLHGLKTAVDNHPDRAKEVLRFLSYYLPEAVRLMLSYHEYQSAELEGKSLQKTYSMITDSIDTLDAAVEQKILSIYSMEAMETRAKADALKQILEQDGYSKGSQLLKH